MQTFTISGHFEADDIDDAIARLAQHFAELADYDGTGPLTLGLSEIRVSPRRRRQSGLDAWREAVGRKFPAGAQQWRRCR